VTCNGIPVWHCSTREKVERYATDAEHRASLIATKYADCAKAGAGARFRRADAVMNAIIGLAIFIFWWMK
jgi:hypothetical protein